MSRHIKIKKGMDLPMHGAPEQVIHPGADIQHVALCGRDYIGLKPRVLVSEGDAVVRGQPLLVDKRDPDVNYCSPAQGIITAIHRGPRRVLDSIVVRLENVEADDIAFQPLSSAESGKVDTSQVARRLQQSGLWTAFRTRPFGQVPRSDSNPGAIFVTATDTRPLSASPAVVAHSDPDSFITGLKILPRLTEGTVYLCTGPEWDIAPPDLERLQCTTFSGPHPAGLAGTHIHHLYPVGPGRVAWQIDYQDVIAIGKLFAEGVVPSSRVVALGGKCLSRPRLVETLLGACLDEVLADGIAETEGYRVLSGSALDGRSAFGSVAYLGRYHNQVTVISEGGERRFLGWLGGRGRRRWSTAQNGRFSGMIPLQVFDRVMPLDILPASLLRALLVKDTDQAQALGCLELDEEDLALCAYVCPAKTDYGEALRINLDHIEREG
jgi:Na+-transporting NADH:ubiquinone oxidoreductase subunit A